MTVFKLPAQTNDQRSLSNDKVSLCFRSRTVEHHNCPVWKPVEYSANFSRVHERPDDFN